jgi:ABC-type glycerol-3-phosphate transport system permease component
VTIPATVIPILIAAFAAYALAWMKFPGRALIVATVVGLLVVPLQMSLIPLLQLYNGVGAFFGVPDGKTYLGIWLAHTGFGLPLAIYLLRNYMAGLPREIMESARIDGASDFEIFTGIVLPLSFPALASFAIFQFLWVWNDLLVAMVFLGAGSDKLVLTGKLVAARLARRQLGNPDGRRLHHHRRAADRVLLAAALLRARPAGRLGEPKCWAATVLPLCGNRTRPYNGARKRPHRGQDRRQGASETRGGPGAPL